jgi:hypothetical protein
MSLQPIAAVPESRNACASASRPRRVRDTFDVDRRRGEMASFVKNRHTQPAVMCGVNAER